MMEFIDSIRSQSNFLLVLGVSILLTIVVVVLVLYVVHLKNKLNNFENPRYGFLGKSIYPMVGFIGMGMVLVFATFGVISPDVENTQAEIQLDGKINAQVQSQGLNDVNVKLSFEPRLNGSPWGDINDTFDIYWDISGPIDINKTEVQSSKFTPSGFVAELKKGSYTVKITVVYQGETFNFEDHLSY